MECIACGRALSNDPTSERLALWTQGDQQEPYCADSEDCARDAGDLLSERTCSRCGRTPAAGYASVWTSSTGTLWLCHGDDDEPSCYETAFWPTGDLAKPLIVSPDVERTLL